MKRIFLLLSLASLLAFPLSAAAEPVSGKVSVDGIGRGGVTVNAWPLESLNFNGKAPYSSAPSDADGRFTLDLKPGEYYFLAGDKEVFGYYGRNPVLVGDGGLKDLKLSLPVKNPPLPEETPKVKTGVIGKITWKGKPLDGASLMIYTDLNTQLKGMGLGMTAPSSETGYVEAPIQPGTYYLVARKRASGQFSGPLQAGDFFGYYAGNPVRIKPGEVARIGIDMVEVPEKVERLAATLFGQTSIRGRIIDEIGAPVGGVRVLLYADSTMLNRPLYVSQPSASNGEYILSFPQGGTYYLAARDRLGGAPGPGELYGRYSGSPDSSIRIRTGQALEGIDLQVQKMW